MSRRSQAKAPVQIIRRQRVLLVVAVVSLLVCVAGLVAVWNIKSPQQLAAEQEPPSPSVLRADVVEKVLAQQVTVRGSVVSDSVAVKVLMTATPTVVTATPKVVGAKVSEGDVLLEVSGRPVIVLQGSVPAYREIGSEKKGTDVAQLQQALTRMGFLKYKVTDGVFGSATSSALKQMYAKLGYTTACDGGTSRVCLGEIVFVPSLPAKVAAVNVKVGGALSGTDPDLSLSLGDAAVTAMIPAGQQEGMVPGLHVQIDDDANRRSCEGALENIGEFTAASGSDATGLESQAGYPVVVVAKKCLDAAWVGRNVRVTIDVTSTSEPVLVVPTSAVQIDVNNVTFVEVLATDLTTRRVEVSTGLTTAGEVAVTPLVGQSLAAGQQVVTR